MRRIFLTSLAALSLGITVVAQETTETELLFSGRQSSDCPAPAQSPLVGMPLDLADFELTLSRTACYGACPVYTVKIAADGTVTYDGVENVAIKGPATGRISVAAVRELTSHLIHAGFMSLCGKYSTGVTDQSTTITSLRINGVSKVVSNYGASGPEALNDLEKEVDAAVDSHRWRHGDPQTETLWDFREIWSDAVMPKPGTTALMRAAGKSDVKTLRELLGKGPDVDAQDTSGWTALMYAAGNDNAAGVDLLLRAGANPNLRSHKNETALMAAAADIYEGGVEICDQLLKAGAEVNVQNTDNETALMWAAYLDPRPKVVSALISAGANLNLRDSRGDTALSRLLRVRPDYGDDGSDRLNHEEVLRLLRKAGAKE